jgi:hypothetical protein
VGQVRDSDARPETRTEIEGLLRGTVVDVWCDESGLISLVYADDRCVHLVGTTDGDDMNGFIQVEVIRAGSQV